MRKDFPTAWMWCWDPASTSSATPLCGRNFEYFSEDPCIAGAMSAAWVQGAQSTGAGTSLKHFAANNQEYKRFNGNSQVDERTLRELYLPAFETVVKAAQPETVMCSYPRINNVHASDNHWLLDRCTAP
ncbi:MAG: glycoside hydrolase family 3 N-terminal domain-containing protein [Subdoligranulum sp.]